MNIADLGKGAAGAVADGVARVSQGANKVVATAVDAAHTIIDTAKEHQPVTPEQIQELLDVAYRRSIEGVPNVSKSVEELVGDYAAKYESREKAAVALINNQLMKCTTSGFLSGLTGVLALPVTLASIPANIANVLYVQVRMVASLALLGGYDVESDQVQTMVYVCMAGNSAASVLKDAGVQVGNKLALSALKSLPGSVLTAINQKVGFRLVTKFGETGVVNLGKLVPVVGGLVGGGFDFATTRIIATTAYRQFIGDADDSIESEIIGPSL